MKKSYLLIALFCLSSLTANAQPYAIQQYLNIKSATAPTFSPDGKSLAYLTNVTGTAQVWAVDMPNGKPRQLTNYDDNVSFVRWLSDGSGIVFGKAKGGDENTQFFWMKPDGTSVRALTNEPGVRHNFGLISSDGRFIAYASNKRNRLYFDIYSMEIASGKEDLLYRQDGNNSIIAVNDNRTKIILSRDGFDLSLDNNLFLIDVNKVGETNLTAHKGAAEFGNAHFTADGIVYTQNDKREFTALSNLRQKNAAGDDWSPANRETAVIDDTKWDVSEVEMQTYGSHIAYTVNREGFSELYVRKYETNGKPLITVIDKTSEAVKLPGQGVVSGLAFNHDESKLAFSFNSATQNGDIWVYDLNSKSLSQVTKSDTAGIDPKSFVEPRLMKYKSFDGTEISAWYYKNPHEPVTDGINIANTIVSVHGGPESQERPGFNPLYQYYLSRKYRIIATNVRGSTGYGKSFTHLDDVRNREDSVKDIASLIDFLKKNRGNDDVQKFAIMGGSYGGYMTLAAITLYPDTFAAAVDTVGIANWESFFKNTSGYRKRQREVEYGSMDKDGDFLRSISPIAKVDRIKTPLFVIAGKNDPRVPYTEAEQIVGALKKRRAAVQYKLYEDEGHGISKLKNRLELYPLVADFLDKYMK